MLNLFQSTSIPALEQTAIFAQRRHQVLAGNMANADTPGYRSRDLKVDAFQEALAESIHEANTPRTSPPMSASALAFAPPSQVGEVQPEFADGPRKAMEQVVFHDGSDVGLETQVTQIAKNQHTHNLAIALMRSQFNVLRAAITERA
ncbi:flagellar basal body rod protein FlgB [Roseimaritima multifibrata]|uniref:Flagellar basal body rod protein FlgB n=1 Tax=Roseimaritima multifibrata TaxID=1930274 RepID=A0A517MKP1_9BACT|nr:flagellar basal body rod protein FlgB [Roseimaritima multifibrata]QDS95465.1 flagellar basal body rod protein FlgB [Roseimaritima multifibrata]